MYVWAAQFRMRLMDDDDGRRSSLRRLIRVISTLMSCGALLFTRRRRTHPTIYSLTLQRWATRARDTLRHRWGRRT